MSTITSGETVETVAHDIAHHVWRRADSLRGELDHVPETLGVIAMNGVRFSRWLERALLDAEETIAACIREHTTPRVVTTVEELDTLPVRSVVRELDTGPFLGIETVPGVFEKFPNDLGWFCVAGHGDRTAEIEFPATVLYEPEATP